MSLPRIICMACLTAAFVYCRNTTTIPDILKRHGLIAEDVLEEKNYPLLELDAPAVCVGWSSILDILARLTS